jgi:hypothetical protein
MNNIIVGDKRLAAVAKVKSQYENNLSFITCGWRRR